MLFTEKDFSRYGQGRTVRGQYDQDTADIYKEAAKFFPNMDIRDIGQEGETVYLPGGSFVVSPGYVGLEISGHSDKEQGSQFKSFYNKVEELAKNKQEKPNLVKT